MHVKRGRLIGVFDKEKKRKKEIGQKFKTKTFASFSQILADPEVRCLVIATPHFLHFSQAKKALLAKKHVFCEKPLGLNLKEVKEILALARKQNLRLTVDLPLRSSPIFKLVKRLIKTKIFGPLHSVFFQNLAGEYRNCPPWYQERDKSGGWFLTSEIHFFDLLNHLLGFPQKIIAWETKDMKGKTKKTSSLLSFSGKIKAMIYHDLDTPPGQTQTLYLFLFERGVFLVRGWIPQKGEVFSPFSFPGREFWEGGKNWQVRKESDKHYQLHCITAKEEEYRTLIGQLFAKFLENIQNPKTKPLISAREIEEGEKIALQAQKSADSL